MDNAANNLKVKLEKLRINIDQIDSSILNLINQRLALGEEIGCIKKLSNTDVVDSSREKQIIEKILNNNNGLADEQLLKDVFNIIITATKNLQENFEVNRK